MTAKVTQKVQNASFTGSGALGDGDRGAFHTVPAFTGNPYDSQDFVFRWRQYVRLYEMAWEARKIVRIIPEDALRKDWLAEDIPEEMAKGIQSKLTKLQFNNVLKRSLILERLLGGCLTFLGVDGVKDETKSILHPSPSTVLRFCNAIPISRISRVTFESNPLSEHYMRPSSYLINSEPVHVSRCLVWDGEPLFDPYDFALTNFRSNLAGFGPSKLAPIWDDVVKAVGTRQAAYQLIQTNNSILVAVNELQSLSGTKSGREALSKVKDIANQLSVYRAALIDGDKIDVKQHSASFGSVPELIITFIQVLAAASDIPATRFLGQAPGGLNATGDSDLENYYNVIDAYQRQRIEPQLRRVYDLVGYSTYGEKWKQAREKLTFKFPPLWNLSELEEADRTSKIIDNVMKLSDAGFIDDKKVIEELNAKGALSVNLDETDISLVDDTGLGDGVEVEGELDRLRGKSQGQVPSAYPGGGQKVENARIERGTRKDGVCAVCHTPTNGYGCTIKGTRGGDMLLCDDHADDDEVLAGLRKKGIINALHLDRLPTPSPNQVRAGNYKKHHIKIHGLDVAIENPKGSERSGTTPDGHRWSSILPAHYGYVKKTEGADGDHVDVYLGPHETSEEVFIVDQLDLEGNFDEHKCIFGALSLTQAKELYLSGFSDGKAHQRLGQITPVKVEDFKQWLKDGDTKKPFANALTKACPNCGGGITDAKYDGDKPIWDCRNCGKQTPRKVYETAKKKEQREKSKKAGDMMDKFLKTGKFFDQKMANVDWKPNPGFDKEVLELIAIVGKHSRQDAQAIYDKHWESMTSAGRKKALQLIDKFTNSTPTISIFEAVWNPGQENEERLTLSAADDQEAFRIASHVGVKRNLGGAPETLTRID